MKCWECERLGLTSYTHVGVMTSTNMHCPTYYDSKGRFHDHDLNERVQHYSCTRGHEWEEMLRNTCPSCDYDFSGSGTEKI